MRPLEAPLLRAARTRWRWRRRRQGAPLESGPASRFQWPGSYRARASRGAPTASHLLLSLRSAPVCRGCALKGWQREGVLLRVWSRRVWRPLVCAPQLAHQRTAAGLAAGPHCRLGFDLIRQFKVVESSPLEFWFEPRDRPIGYEFEPYDTGQISSEQSWPKVR